MPYFYGQASGQPQFFVDGLSDFETPTVRARTKRLFSSGTWPGLGLSQGRSSTRKSIRKATTSLTFPGANSLHSITGLILYRFRVLLARVLHT
jgi:hypothetical protein